MDRALLVIKTEKLIYNATLLSQRPTQGNTAKNPCGFRPWFEDERKEWYSFFNMRIAVDVCGGLLSFFKSGYYLPARERNLLNCVIHRHPFNPMVILASGGGCRGSRCMDVAQMGRAICEHGQFRSNVLAVPNIQTHTPEMVDTLSGEKLGRIKDTGAFH